MKETLKSFIKNGKVEEAKVFLQEYTRIDLNLANLKGNDARVLANILRGNTELTHLSVSNNLIGNEAAQQLISALTNCSSLVYLDLSLTVGEPLDVGALVELIRTTSSLKYLNLSNNTISEEGLVALTDAIKNNGSLVEVVVDYHHIEPARQAELASAMQTYLVRNRENTPAREASLLGLLLPVIDEHGDTPMQDAAPQSSSSHWQSPGSSTFFGGQSPFASDPEEEQRLAAERAELLRRHNEENNTDEDNDDWRLEI